MRIPNPKPLILIATSRWLLIGFLTTTAFSQAQNPASPPPAPAEAVRGVTVPAVNGVELQATINGQGPFDAVFDTGSGNLMTAALAKRLGLKAEGSTTINGGGGLVPSKVVKVESIKIGGLVMADQWFAVIDTPLTKDQNGIFVGDMLLRNLAIRVDFERQQITFYPQQSFKYSGDGFAVPIHSDDGTLLAEASVDGLPGQFGIDTGDMFSLTLFAPFVAKHDLVRHYGATIRGYTGEGWGGADHGFYARANQLQLGQTSVRQPITVLSTDTQGAESSNTIAGNIGLRVLKQFTLVFDDPHGKLYLEKNGNYGKPDIFNRAGLVLDPDPEKLAVKTVVPGSPAALAGMAEEDVIAQIDGSVPTDDSIQSAFTQPVGTVVHLTVRRGNATRTVPLVLHEVL